MGRGSMAHEVLIPTSRSVLMAHEPPSAANPTTHRRTCSMQLVTTPSSLWFWSNTRADTAVTTANNAVFLMSSDIAAKHPKQYKAMRSRHSACHQQLTQRLIVPQAVLESSSNFIITAFTRLCHSKA